LMLQTVSFFWRSSMNGPGQVTMVFTENAALGIQVAKPLMGKKAKISPGLSPITCPVPRQRNNITEERVGPRQTVSSHQAQT